MMIVGFFSIKQTHLDLLLSLFLFSGMFLRVLGVILIGLSAWAFPAFRPPATKICGSVGGPPITSPRIKLRDGRHLAYEENGVSRTVAKFKIIYVHGFSSCKHDPEVAIYPSPVFSYYSTWIQYFFIYCFSNASLMVNFFSLW